MPSWLSRSDRNFGAVRHRRRHSVLTVLVAAVMAGVVLYPVTAQDIPDVAQEDATESGEIALELVDMSGLSTADTTDLIDQLIVTTAQIEQGASLAAGPEAQSQRRLHPTTNEPFHTVLTGTDVVNAQARFDSMSGTHLVDVELSTAGADTMARFTEAHIGEAMGIVVYGRLVSAPIIRDRLGREFIIQGNFSEEEARNLAARLVNASPLPQDLVEDPRAPLLLSTDFSFIVDSIGAILLLVVILLL